MRRNRAFSFKAPVKILLHALIFFFLAFSASAASEDEPVKRTHPLDGSWRWNFTMPDGSTSRPKLELSVENGKLSGNLRFRPGTQTRITNAVLSGDKIRFEIVRYRDGQAIVTTYSGKWTDQLIKGTIESNWAGEKQSYEWEAKRGHVGVEGSWRWQTSFRGGNPFTVRADLEQDGEIVTGSMPFRGFGGRGRGGKIDIKNGSIKNGEIYFETEFGTDEDKRVTIYKGKQTGDVIEGTIERTNSEGEQVTDDWYAKRAD